MYLVALWLEDQFPKMYQPGGISSATMRAKKILQKILAGEMLALFEVFLTTCEQKLE